MGEVRLDRSYAALCTGIFLIKFGFGIGVAFLTVWMKFKGISLVEIGAIGTATNLVGTSSVMFWGWFCNRYGRMKMIVSSGLVLAGVLYPTYVISDSFLLFLLLGILNGVARAMFNESAPLLTLVTAIIGPRRMGSRYGRYRTWGTVGYVIAATSAGVFATRFGIPSVFIMGCIAYLLGSFAVSAYVNEKSVTRKPTQSTNQRTDSRIHWRDILQRNLLVFIATSTLSGIIQGSYGLFTLNLNRLGASEALIGLSVAVGAIAEVPVMIYAGALSDRVGRKAVLVFSHLVPTVTLSLIGLLTDPYLAMMAFSLKGVSGGIDFSVSAIYLADEVPPERRSLIYGLVNSLKSVGSILGPYAVAVVADRYGMANMYLIVAIYNLVPAALFAFGTKTKKPQETPAHIETIKSDKSD